MPRLKKQQKPTSPPKTERTERLSFDLSDESVCYVLMQILSKKVLRMGNEEVPLQLPEGCLGFMLVFDTKEAADKYFGGDAYTMTLKKER